MKISQIESGKASAAGPDAEAKILPDSRPKRSSYAKPGTSRKLSPLERGMAVAEAALADTPDTREETVEELKARIEKGEYKVSGEEIAEMMLRRRAADRIR